MVLRILIIVILAMAVSNCAETDSAPFNAGQSSSVKKYLYVVSGSCYGGGVTVSTGPSSTVARFSLTTGLLDKVIID